MADEFNQNNEYNEYENEQASDGGYQNVGSSGTNTANNDGYASGSSASSGSTGNGNYQYSNEYNNSYSNSGSGNTGSSDNNGGKKKGNGGMGKALFAVLLAVIFGICAGAGAFGISRLYSNKEAGEATTQAAVDAEDDSDETAEAAEEQNENKADLVLETGDAVHTQITEVAQNVMPAIVSVYNNYTASQQTYWGTYSQEATSAGSGIIIANTGDELLIATNNHVVDGADSLEVKFIDDNTAAANLKGTDSGNDLAVIAVSLDDIDDETKDAITVATLGSSDDLVIGEPVVAIGNALGYGQSVTSGIVSALNREMTTEDGETGVFIQTDAAINPGNSGGALCDMNGNVIGINSNKIGGTTVEGMGYAIPMSTAEPIIEKLASQQTKIAVDEENKGYLGIAGVSVTSDVANAYNMPEGAYVAEIYDGTGAAKSDLQKGDIITGVNGSTVESMTELQEELSYYEAGTEITLTVQRVDGGGEYAEQEIQLTLSGKDTMPSDDEAATSSGSNDKEDATEESTESAEEATTEDAEEQNEQAPAGNSSADENRDQPRQNGGWSGSYQFPWGNFGF